MLAALHIAMPLKKPGSKIYVHDVAGAVFTGPAALHIAMSLKKRGSKICVDDEAGAVFAGPWAAALHAREREFGAEREQMTKSLLELKKQGLP